MSEEYYHRRVVEQLALASNVLSQLQLQQLQSINHTFDHVLHELHALRQTQEAGVHLQQTMLTREVFQDAVEEFVYNFQKTLTEFAAPGCPVPPELQFHQLRWVVEQIDSQGLSTACVRGRDNKAAFDACLAQGKALYRQLAKHPEVRRVIAAEEAERRKLAAAAETERQRQLAAEEAEERKQRARDARRREREAEDRAAADPGRVKLTAGVCAILLGSLGVHKFVLGMTVPGVILLVAAVLSCGASLIVTIPLSVVEGIIYLTKSDDEFYRTYMVGKKGWF